MCRLSKKLGNAVYTDGTSHSIHIRDTVSHNDNLVRCLDRFPQGMCLDARLDTGILFLLDAFAAIVQYIFPRFHYDLVAAAGEGKIKKVAAHTYIITPYHVDIEGDLIDELENNGLYF